MTIQGVIDALRGAGWLTASQIEERLGLDRGSAKRAIRALKERGDVEENVSMRPRRKGGPVVVPVYRYNENKENDDMEYEKRDDAAEFRDLSSANRFGTNVTTGSIPSTVPDSISTNAIPDGIRDDAPDGITVRNLNDPDRRLEYSRPSDERMDYLDVVDAWGLGFRLGTVVKCVRTASYMKATREVRLEAIDEAIRMLERAKEMMR